MLTVTADAGALADETVRALLISRAEGAQRLANWILHDPIAAEDAVQEAALLAWHRRRSLRDPDTVDAWFNRILVNVCRQELRRRGRRPALIEIEPGIEGDHSRLHDRDELTRVIGRLSPDEQVLVALRFGRDLTVPQIAAGMGMAEGTVKSRLHYALEHLRAALEAERRGEEKLR
jgi:RNA polymerase sigma-70 factor (ECF subfamily)